MGRAAPTARLVQARPSRASRTRVTASGKITRIASRTGRPGRRRALELDRVNRGDGHVNRELDRVVGPSHLLGALHLLGELLHAAAHLVGVPEEAAESSGFHVPIIGDDRRAFARGREGRGVGSTIKCQDRGAAAVEQVALGLLIAMLVVAGVGALAGAPPSDSARELGGTIARRIACAPATRFRAGATRWRSPTASRWASSSATWRRWTRSPREDCCRLTTAAAGWRTAPRSGPGRG